MNKSQKILTIVAMVVFLVTLVLFPVHEYHSYKPFWLAARPNMAQAYTEWIAIAVIYFGIRSLLASPSK